MPRSKHAPTRRERVLAKAILTVAADGGMPDSFWLTDSRIALACEVTGWPPENAREWAYAQVGRQ